jgi:glycosyltransferase involved in cell wall biosynthesis
MTVRETLDSLTDGALPQHIDLICLSHLRWDFVFQRPQHLLTRFAKERRVFFIEEPIHVEHGPDRLQLSRPYENLIVATPHLQRRQDQEHVVAKLIDELLREHSAHSYVLWYYTPMSLAFSRHLSPRLVVYDCMDELSAFIGAPPAMRAHEQELLERADVVFTGGRTLYESKKDQHPNVHPFPSSIDMAHFRTARTLKADPEDQRNVPHPRIGFYGVIDERMDLDLLTSISSLRPDWQFVIIGPVVKIDPNVLPQARNLHYLGRKEYDELPSYLAGWDVAMLPFAQNDSTRFISPTKTPEYLAAGRPVVSTPIADVIRPYGNAGIVQIADGPTEFVAGIERALNQRHDPAWQEHVDGFLANNSWDRTWQQMRSLMAEAMEAKYASL